MPLALTVNILSAYHKNRMTVISRIGAVEDLLAGRRTMKNLLKINLASILFALPVFAAIEGIGNALRISRITGWEYGRVERLITVLNIAGFILTGFLIVYITRRVLENRRISLISSFLWFPYFTLFTYGFASLFPLTVHEDKPTPVTGLIFIGILILHFLYLVFVQVFSIFLAAEEQK